MARKYRIKNWSKFQHYKDRNPPWIKLHVELLASEDWVTLADASKLLMVVCMVIAARENGIIPGSADYIKRVAYLDKRPDLTPLIECGFLEELLADASESKQAQASARPEKEAEGETEKKDTPIAPKGAAYPKDFESFWTLYPEKKGKDAAHRAWRKREKNRTLPSLETLVEAIGRYINGKPVDVNYKHPATWLNGGCWMDEYTTPTAAPAVSAGASTVLTLDDWRNAVRRFLKDDTWPASGYGPQPGFGGCRVPAEIVAEFNLDGLTPPAFLKRTA